MSRKPLLKVEGVGHSYGATRVLRDVSFELHEGELVAVLGASGSGKSTLLRSIAGFVCASEGKLFLEERLLSEDGNERVSAERRGVGLVFQDYALFPHMTVADNVSYGIGHGENKAERVEELLRLVNLEGLGDRKPNSLSGGQKQRVALARALAPRPKVLLLDEPFANLDGPIRLEVGHAVRDILRKTGAAGVLVTHDRVEALALADRVAVLGSDASEGLSDAARLLQLDTPEGLFLRPSSVEVARLTGFVFTVDGVSDGTIANTAFGDVSLVSEKMGPVTLLVRRHQVVFEAGTGPDTVLDCRFVGPGYRVLVQSSAGQVWVDHLVSLAIGSSGRVGLTGPCMAIEQGS